MITINQFLPSVSKADSVTNALFYTQKILQEMGFDSKIYSANIPKELKDKVLNIKNYKQNKNQYLLYHYAIYTNWHDKILNFEDKKILVYHNITPHHFFKKNSFFYEVCYKARYEQLKTSAKYFLASYTDSSYNTQELKNYNYKNIYTIPILVDFQKIKSTQYKNEILIEHSDTINILFVGRFISNKAQDLLIDTLFILKKYIQNIKLILIGSISDKEYYQYLKQKANFFNLEKNIIFLHECSDEELISYYNVADIYLSLSEHEGFGMPIVESQIFDTITLAYNVGGVKDAVSKLGLLNYKAPIKVAQRVLDILNTPSLKTKIIKSQRENLKSLNNQAIKEKLYNFFKTLNLNPKKTEPANYQEKTIQIEGPFDSSYSLAIVNQNISKALNKINFNIKLHSTEGYGDYSPNINYLKNYPEIISLYRKELSSIDITIRNTYPPRTDSMQGFIRAIGPYGWEESAFISKYVEQFNLRLTHLLVMSNYVKKVMIENGVKIPIYVTGIGANHILSYKEEKIQEPLPQGFKLLHISSCFPRKGVDILLKVFKELSDLNISLIIKTFPNPHNNIVEELNKLPQEVREKILLINRDLTPSEITYLYKNSNALVAPSFGEGFGLPLAEAMLFELPVITTAYGGQRDFCTNDTAWLVDFTFQKAKSHFNLFNSYQAVPLKNDLKNKIIQLYNAKKEDIEIKTKKAKENILSNYTWDVVAKRVLNSLHKNQDEVKKDLKLAWVSTYNTKCGIASYSHSILSHIKDKFNYVKIFANKVSKEDILNKNLENNIKRVWVDRFQKDNKELINAIKQKDFTHIVIEFNFAFFSMQNLKEIIEENLDKNITVELHSVEDVTIKGLEASLKEISQTLAKVNHIIVHNISDLNILKSFNLIENVSFLPLPIDIPKINRFQATKKSLLIATFGFLLPHKGVLELVEAFSILKKDFPEAKLLLLNALYPLDISKNYKKLIEDKINSLNLQNSVTFITNYLSKEEIYLKLSDATLFVLPYHHTQESSSAAIKDVVALKKPILTTKEKIFDDLSDIIFYINSPSPQDIYNAIKNLLTNKTLLSSKLSLQEKWINEHNIKKIADRFFNIIKQDSFK